MNIAIWGMGVSGQSAFEYLNRHSEHQLFLIDSREKTQWCPKNASPSQCYREVEFAELKPALDFIVLSPGIHPDNPHLQTFSLVEKICEVELAFRDLPSNIPIIGVTGTNGKTTTVTLIHQALAQAGRKPFLGGNIGTPFCELFKTGDFDCVVLELSSFQLELMPSFKAQVAVILNITASHMERYADFESYEKAKLNIARLQSAKDLLIAPAKYQTDQSQFCQMQALKGYDWTRSKLKGEHHLFNFFVVEKILDFFKISEKEEIVQQLIDEFKGVKFRLEFMGEHQGVKFYNDAKSTNTSATISAVKSFQKDELTLFLGGKKRDHFQDWSQLKQYPQIKRIVAFGEAREEIFEQLAGTFDVVKLEQLNESALSMLRGHIALMSPGYPSFDQFKNYLARGEFFEKLFRQKLL